MKRKLEQTLIEWKDKIIHLPLIIRGARQVGKSYLVEAFGKTHFESLVKVNFEQSPEFKACFTTLKPQEILAALELGLSQKITPGKTLLFLDEIQECPEAIKALRYFKEEYPELHIIAAGSLLEFTLHKGGFSMPVGRVQFLHLKPLSFEEFLWAFGQEQLWEYVSQFKLGGVFFETAHQKLLESVRLYLKLGGMPAVIETYMRTNSLLDAVHTQLALLQTYRADFAKYGTQKDLVHLETLFNKLPRLATQQIKYSKVNPEVQARELKGALEKLVFAGLITPIFHSNASGLPLAATKNNRKFKTLFLDVGLMLRAQGMIPMGLVTEDVLFLLQGAMMEQFVGQELLVYEDPYMTPELFFWSREEKGATAEVDYVITAGLKILPIEVKSTSLGHLKALKRFMEEKNSPLGIRISEHPFSFERGILSVPLYAIFALNSYLKQVLQ